MFFDLGGPLRRLTNDALSVLLTRYGDGFDAVGRALLGVLLVVENALRTVPPGLVLAFVFALAYILTKHVQRAFVLTALLYLIGCLGLWEASMQTLALLLVAIGFAVVIGIPAGIAMSRSVLLRTAAVPILDLMQTIPIFVYLLPVAMLFGLGKVPALIATLIYSMPPLVRLTDLGLRQVDESAIDAAATLGASSGKILMRVELPLAWPSVLQGLNQTVMLALGMVVVASMIGARGLGESVLLGLQRNDSGQGLVGGIAIVALAIVVDRLSQALARRSA
jgi:glycine betaine/proline transport system permease protein